MPNRLFKIHPAIGVARLGNADRSTNQGFFIGPETPGLPANWDLASGKFLPFKLDGRVKAQAARFRIWLYEEKNGKMVPARELTLDSPEVVTIEWRVHLANRKASFFTFEGQRGAADNYAAHTGRRNATIPEAERAQRLEIDEGAKTVSGRSAAKVEFRNSKQPDIPIEMLGELRTDAQGRLLVLGGRGQSNSSASLPPPPGTTHPVPLRAYANNDTWFDDVSDGPVTAVVTVRTDGGATEQIEAEGTWVMVGPPDFGPAMGNVVTLYDALWDVAVRELTIPANNALYDEYDPGKGLKRLREMNSEWSAANTLTNFKPSFTQEIFPIFHRAFLTRWVHEPLALQPVPSPHHDRIADARAERLAELPGNPLLRKSIFNRLRNPDSVNVNTQGMPKVFGDNYNPDAPVASSYLTLTRTQFALLRQWMAGKFVSDWAGFLPKPIAENITPEGLDRAALDNCVGGGFFPGIEASWLIRKKEIFSEPFRIRHGATLGALSVRASSRSRWPYRGRLTFSLARKSRSSVILLGPRSMLGGLLSAQTTSLSRPASLRWLSGRAG